MLGQHRSTQRKTPQGRADEEALLEALKTVVDPHSGKDFVSAKEVKNVRVNGNDVALDIETLTEDG